MLGKILSKIKKLTTKSKVLLSILAAAAVILPVTSTVADTSVNTNSPRFNFLQGDVEMLQVAKATDNTWSDPITTSNGEKILFLMYFHNGVLNTTAHNVKARVDLPTDASTTLKSTSYLWSDETPYITDTVVNGQIVGNSGATVNVPTAARMRYVPGSTRIYQNGSQTGEALADGITSSNGINIGSIQGCWQYSGYITFQAELFGNSKMTIDKSVANIGGAWSEQINANPGDTVAYELAIRNDGDLSADNVKVTDQLAIYTSYIPGTTYLYNKTTGPNTGIKQADTLTTSGINLNGIVPGNDGITYLKFKAKIDTNIPAGIYGLVNVGSVYLSNILQDTDEAKVVVTSTSVINLDKRVYDNVTRNWEKISNGVIGDVKTFKITVTNSGNTPLKAVKVRDILPIFTNLTGNVTMNGVVLTPAQSNSLFSTGLSVGDLGIGCSNEIVFQVVVQGCPPLGESLLTNTAYASGTGATEVTSQAQIRITVTAPIAPKVK